MRALSPHPRYSIQVIEGNEQIVVDARGHAHTVVHSKPVIANFEQQGLQEWEIEAALESFNFSGVPEGVNPLTRIAVFDSEAYVLGMDLEDPKAEKELIDRIDGKLVKLQKRHPSEFILVEKPGSPKPWPSYDGDSVEDILAAQQRFEFSAESIRLYEIENQKRQEIIDAMSALEDPVGTAATAAAEQEAITVSA